jgi:LysM repeat protein
MSIISKSSIACVFLFAGISAQAKTYVVKKGETLASVARSYYGEPVFGPKGSINKIYKMNPWAKSSVVLKPGQELVLEDKAVTQAPSQEEAQEPAPPPPPIHAPAPLPAPEEKAVEMSENKPAPPPPPPPMTPPPPPREEPLPPPPHPPVERAEHEDLPRNYISIIPSYSQVNQTATETASGASFTLDRTQTYGAELGWDHWWNPSFSTLLTYSLTQIKSTSVSPATGMNILDSTNLNRAELALLNRVMPRLRLGFGAAYGDHLFLETLGATPQDPTIYKTAFWNPFVAAEITAVEREAWELLLNLKVSALPAQVGSGHDLKSGTEYFGQLSLLQKFNTWAMTYGISYGSEDQTRSDASETRTETAFKIGVLF